MRTRKLLLAAGIPVLILAAAWAAREPLLMLPARVLIAEDPLEKTDILFLLNGDQDTRPFEAVRLWKAGWAPKIVVARAETSPTIELGLTPNATDVGVGVLRKLGVPDSAIVEEIIPGGVTSTYDEAVTLRKYAEREKIGSINIVTSSFHTRRARWITRKVLAGLPVKVRVHGVHDRHFTEKNWWKVESGFMSCQNEYLKFLYYGWKYL